MVGDNHGALNVVRELYWALKRRLYMSRRAERDAAERFHMLFYDAAHFGSGWSKTSWLGTPIWKSPLDLWIYQEILHETKPDVIVETGTYRGGSAFYLASLCDLLGRGRVITIDTESRPDRPPHPRITYLHGSSIDPVIVQNVRASIMPEQRVMVVLDSDHTRAHVLAELRIHSPLVTRDCYLIVEDTNINGHPAWPEFGPGPFEAVEEFLCETTAFMRDRERERFMLTFNPGGYLRRVQ
jgi:cephalosporin hydroxylase